MNKTLLYLALFFSGFAFSQTIAIPDAQFKAALLLADTNNGIARDMNQNYIVVDTNNNNEIEVSEALTVYHLMVGMYDIYSLTGVENFANLETLECSSNFLTSLDVTSLTNLRDLSCNNNQLASLNVAGLAELEWLSCSNNNLTSLNLAGCTMLHDLDFSYNQLTNIDLSAQQSTLTSLTGNDNALTALNLAGFTLLDYLYVEYNNMTVLDLTGCSGLFYVAASNNQIESLDVSDSPLLELLDADSNQIEVLIIKNGMDNSDSFYDFWGNPLQYLCVDEAEAEAYVEILLFYGYDNVVMNSYCSFTPGGNYNTIAGTFTFDADGNGCDAADAPQSFVKANINDGSATGSTFSTATGNYSFYTQEGTFTITPEFENDWFTVTPVSATAEFPTVDNSTQTHNFCVTANGVHSDAEIVIVPLLPAQPGFDAEYKIVYRNNGNQVLSGSVTLSFPAEVVDIISAYPVQSASTDTTLTWDYANLLPFEDRDIFLTFNVNAPTETPAVNIDDILVYSATVTTNATDETPADNTFVYEEVVVGSFDPNDIQCLEGETATPDVIGDYLHYNVNFENTGTAPATFIVVELDINAADFDINTLQILDASHNMDVTVEGNRVEFYFDAINLGPLEHGNILFKIESNGNLSVGDEVMNKANIFFDYNFPIETNEAATVFEALSMGEFAIDETVNVYPNPSDGIVNINCDSTIGSVELYDIQGRMLQTSVINESNGKIDISARAAGIYFLKVKTEKGIRIGKLIKN